MISPLRQRMGRGNVLATVVAMMAMWVCAHRLLFCVGKPWCALGGFVDVFESVEDVAVVDIDVVE